MTKHYNTTHLTKEQNIDLLNKAYKVADHWWVDILDCSKSWARQEIDMSFEDAMSIIYDGTRITVIHRFLPPVEDNLEIGFRVYCTNVDHTNVDYFLWLILDKKYIPEFTKNLTTDWSLWESRK